MMAIKSNTTLSLFSPMPPTRIADSSVHARTLDWYFPEMKTDSVSAANDYPNSYSLIAVNEEDDFGTSYGRLLIAASSLEEIDFFVRISGGFGNETLHYVTGKNIS